MRQSGEDLLFNLCNMGGYLGTDLLTSPIRRMMNRDAEQVGIDPCNPRQKIASLLGSCGMGVALGGCDISRFECVFNHTC